MDSSGRTASQPAYRPSRLINERRSLVNKRVLLINLRARTLTSEPLVALHEICSNHANLLGALKSLAQIIGRRGQQQQQQQQEAEKNVVCFLLNFGRASEWKKSCERASDRSRHTLTTNRKSARVGRRLLARPRLFAESSSSSSNLLNAEKKLHVLKMLLACRKCNYQCRCALCERANNNEI